MAPSTPEGIGPALGRLPSGLFILTTRSGRRRTGTLVSWVQQAGFEPPMASVALAEGRFVAGWIGETGRFVLNQVAAGDRATLRHFARGFGPGDDAFDGIETLDRALGGPVLADALAFLDLEVAGRLEAGGDHLLVLGRVIAGGVLRDGGEPMVHVRRDGSHY